MKQRFLFAIVGLALLAGAVNAASATLPTERLLAGTDQHANIGQHEANIATSLATGTRERRLALFGAILGLLALILGASFSTPTEVRTPTTGRRGRFFVRRRGPPAYLVAA